MQTILFYLTNIVSYLKLTPYISTIAANIGISLNTAILISSSLMITSFVGSIAAIYYFSDDIKNIFNSIINFFNSKDKSKTKLPIEHPQENNKSNKKVRIDEGQNTEKIITGDSLLNPVSMCSEIIDFFGGHTKVKIETLSGINIETSRAEVIQYLKDDINEKRSYPDSFGEKSHNFIQRLFPTKTKSAYEKNAPVVTKEIISIIKKEMPSYGNILTENRDIMLEYFKHYKNNIFKNEECNHNYSRITRISESLRRFGMIAEATSFWGEIDKLLENTKIFKDTNNIWVEERAKLKKQVIGIPIIPVSVRFSDKNQGKIITGESFSALDTKSNNYIYSESGYETIIDFWNDKGPVKLKDENHNWIDKPELNRNTVIQRIGNQAGSEDHQFFSSVIQTLFPLDEPSKNHPETAYIKTEEFKKFKDTTYSMEIMNEHVDLMLKYYESHPDLFSNTIDAHHAMFITRISKSLKIFQMIDKVKLFWTEIDKLVEKNKGKLSESTKTVWQKEKKELDMSVDKSPSR